MRIDVEVYKGPLSKEPMVQFADLVGFLDEVQSGLKDVNEFTNAVARNKDFEDNVSKSPISTEVQRYNYAPDVWCLGLEPAGLWNQIDYFDCLTLKKLRQDNDRLLNQISQYQTQLNNAVSYRNKKAIEPLLVELARLAGTMRKTAFTISIPGTAGQTVNFKVRIATVVYIVTTAEYGNQIHARVDALMKQIADGGYDRKELPLSVYISDTEPTDFVHLFDQWDAATDRSWAWWTVAAIDGTVKDRINMVKRLFADHHWSKVNTAYASGWGKTKMALIKDDIGNWNLKNFDNAPDELLSAYTMLGKTALDKAATLAKNINSGGSASAIESLVNLSRNVTVPGSGERSAGASAQFIAELHNRAEMKLRETANAAIDEDENNKENPQNQNITRKKLIESLDSILQEHRDLIDLASEPVSQ